MSVPATAHVLKKEGKAACQCEEGYEEAGLNCLEKGQENPCVGVTCSYHGRCTVDKNNEAVCACEDGYESNGMECFEITKEDPCRDVNCGNGKCVAVNDTEAKCECFEGYYAEGLQCVSNLEKICGTKVSDGDATRLNTNSDVKKLAGITYVKGDVYVRSSVTDLTPLKNLKCIGGTLKIFEASSLTDLEGLNNLLYVGKDLTVEDNPALRNTSGIGKLQTVGENVLFTDNKSLQTISLPALKKVRGIGVENNDSLKTISSIPNLKKIDKDLEISDNDKLGSISGFGNITHVSGNVSITNNDSLVNLSGFSNLKEIDNGLRIYGNDNLINLSGLENLTILNGNSLSIDYNDKLVSIKSLYSLKTATFYYLYIEDNSSLPNGEAIRFREHIIDKCDWDGDSEIEGNKEGGFSGNSGGSGSSGSEGVLGINGKILLFHPKNVPSGDGEFADLSDQIQACPVEGFFNSDGAYGSLSVSANFSDIPIMTSSDLDLNAPYVKKYSVFSGKINGSTSIPAYSDSISLAYRTNDAPGEFFIDSFGSINGQLQGNYVVRMNCFSSTSQGYNSVGPYNGTNCILKVVGLLSQNNWCIHAFGIASSSRGIGSDVYIDM